MRCGPSVLNSAGPPRERSHYRPMKEFTQAESETVVANDMASVLNSGPKKERRKPRMPDGNAYPYATRLNILYPPLEVIDVQALADGCTDRWYNQTLCRVNDSVVRLGVMQGEYHWHKHDDLDEFFYVVEGQFLIDLEGRTVALGPGQGFVVPKGVVHRTRAPQRAVILMVEGAGIVPTGDE